MRPGGDNEALLLCCCSMSMAFVRSGAVVLLLCFKCSVRSQAVVRVLLCGFELCSFVLLLGGFGFVLFSGSGSTVSR